MADDDEFTPLQDLLDGIDPSAHPRTCLGSGRGVWVEHDGFTDCPECGSAYPVTTTGDLPTHPTGVAWQNVDDIWLAYNSDDGE